jgi:hypothetical protein
MSSMADRLSLTEPQPPTASPRGGQHRPRRRSRQRFRPSSPALADRPDPATAASEAVAEFLRDASAAKARHEVEAAARAAPTAQTHDLPAVDNVADRGAREAGRSFASSQANPYNVREPEDTAGPPGNHAPTTSAALARQLAMPPSASPGAARLVADSVAVQAAAASIAALNRIEATAAKVDADIRAALRTQAELQAGAAAAAETAVRAAESAWEAADAAAAAQARAKTVLIATVVIIIMIVAISMFIPFDLG